MKKLKYFLLTIATALTLGLSAGAAPALALAGCSDNNVTTKQAIQGGINAAAGSGQDCKASSNAGSSLESLIKTILNLMSLVVGILAVIMIIVSGIRFITSGGEPEKAKSAKNTLVYAIIGLAIVAVAQVIVHFVITEANNQVVSSSNQKKP